MVLLITNEKDVTSDYIVRELQKRTSPYYRLNTERIGNGVSVYLNFRKNICYIKDEIKNKIINFSDIRSVYYRRPALPIFENLDADEGEKKYLQSEVFYLLEGIYKLLDNRFWLNPLFKIREAENKIYQLLLAKKIGLMVPDTCYTNIPQEAQDFIFSQKETITKPIKSGYVEMSDKIIFTNRITSRCLNKLELIRETPVCLQEKIKKEADIRVTVVGEDIFAAKIVIDGDTGIVDWRKSKYNKQNYSEFSLPDEVRSKVLELNRIMGLSYSAMDFILRDDGELVFLEVNPNGQWAWIQNQLGLGISKSIVTKLLNGEK